MAAGSGNGRPASASLAAEHRQLQALFAAVQAALAEGDEERVAASLRALRRCIVGHFEGEELLYYPPLRALRPERAADLLAFTRDHQRLVERLEGAQRELDRGAPGEVRRILVQVTEEFARHERSENALLEALQGEVSGATSS